MADEKEMRGPLSAFESPTFGQDGSFRLDKPVGSATISPCGRDVALASRQGLHIIDLDSPWSPPRHLAYHTPWEVADVQWSPFAARDYWVVSTSNQKALVWNLNMPKIDASVEHVLLAHTRAISDINFSAHYPDILATCAVDSFVHCWDLRHPARPAITFCDWFAGATQVKWNRKDSHILASSHDKFLRIWDDRMGAHPLRSIEAHATKIYGVDWNRFETTNLATCSLDKTIKFWDYTKDNNEPEQILKTPFPVWRARHTPFGHGLLAMPQRGNNDLHLYDRRMNDVTTRSQSALSIHTFEGHHQQVKEFLWRPRGNVSANMDDREYQLVSWGADRVLRLHQITDSVLESVGYHKGMEVKRTTGFTRRGAPYKTFRDSPKTDDVEIFGTNFGSAGGQTGMRLPSSSDRNKPSVAFSGGPRNGALRGPGTGTKTRATKDSDPISWMRGVKIGKRNTSPPGLHQSISTILSPTLKAQPSWEVYESLGEEITVVGGKFSKVAFDEVDMQRHRLVVSLSGPWGTEKAPTYVRANIDFLAGYPSTAVPTVSIERTTPLSNDTIKQISDDIVVLTTAFLSHRRSSLETILRYLLGEQSLDEVLQSLKRSEDSEEVTMAPDEVLSSSDEDNEVLGFHDQPQSNNVDTIDPLAAAADAQNNVPLPKACGALWAENGTLVCFFPAKQDKEASIFDQSLRSSARNRNAISEGFGRLHDVFGHRRGHTSTLGTIEDSESELDEFSTSSSESSLSSSGVGIPRHHFMPAMALKVRGVDPFNKLVLDGSQKSSGEVGTAISTAPKTSNFISLHDLSDLLPAKQSLARDYEIGNESQQAAHNASMARQTGNLEIADTWSFIELILQNKVPLQQVFNPLGDGSIIALIRRALSPLRDRDSAIDLSFDGEDGSTSQLALTCVNWGSHPFGQRWLVKSLFAHFEQQADIQMLAMMSCAFSPRKGAISNQETGIRSSTLSSKQLGRSSSYYPSLDVATSLSGLSLQSSPRKAPSGPHSAASSAGASVSDQLAISSENNTPPGYRPLSVKSNRRDLQATSLSTSPEYHRQFHRSNSNLSAFAATFARPFSFTNSAASSPPNSFPKKRISPSGSYLGATPSSITWAATGIFNRSSTTTENPKRASSLSMSDTEDDLPATLVTTATATSGFMTQLKNQDRFHDEGNTYLSLLSQEDSIPYNAYRDAYAHLLHVWNLPIARCEILKFNTPSTSPTTILGIGKTSHDNPDPKNTATIGINIHCKTCHSPFLPASPYQTRCPQCLHPQPPSICLFCNTYLRGLASPCLSCGHTLHASCRRTALAAGLYECVSGCGCICSDHATVEMPMPETDPEAESRSLGGVSGGGGGGDDDHPYHRHQQHRHRHHDSIGSFNSASRRRARDVSPAITIIADYAGEGAGGGGGEEKEDMAGWRGSEWEEMAYDSLARNLRGTGTGRRGSGKGGAGGGGGGGGAGAAGGLQPVLAPGPGPGAGMGVRERGSQIWRG